MVKQNITGCEIVVMNAVWHEGREKTLMEVVDILHSRYQRYWKVQTVSTFLKRLVEKGYVSHYRVGRQYIYRAEIDKKECFQKELRSYVDLWEYGPDEFVCALYKGE